MTDRIGFLYELAPKRTPLTTERYNEIMAAHQAGIQACLAEAFAEIAQVMDEVYPPS